MHGARLGCGHAASTMQSLMPLDLERAVKMVPRNLDASLVRNTYTRLHTFLFILPRTQVVCVLTAISESESSRESISESDSLVHVTRQAPLGTCLHFLALILFHRPSPIQTKYFLHAIRYGIFGHQNRVGCETVLINRDIAIVAVLVTNLKTGRNSRKIHAHQLQTDGST